MTDSPAPAAGITPTTAFQRHMERVRYEAEAFEREQQQWLRERADPQEAWKAFMKQIGRR
jgi:hypothetical protein